MKVSTRVISDINELHEIEGTWNALINKCSDNPFLLSGFVEQIMGFNGSRGWTPLVLVISADNQVVGISTLKIVKKFGVRIAKFLAQFGFSPDFVSYDQYRETCISLTLDFLFRTLRCQLVDLTLPAESLSLRIVKRKCRAKKIRLCSIPQMGRPIVPVNCTWEEFKKLKGSEFRREFKIAERNLDRVGSWRITCAEKRSKKSEITKRIFDVEKMSWKRAYRTQRGQKIDKDLTTVLEGSQYMATTEPDFNWNVWFLELNDKTLSYIVVIKYKEAAYLCKTAYDKRYKKLGPGKFIIHTAIRELFNERQVRSIDFMQDTPVSHTWTSLCLPRARVLMSQNNVLLTIIRSALLSEPMKNILASLSKKVPSFGDVILG